MNAIPRTFEETVVVPMNRNYCVSESGKVGRIGSYGHLSPCRLKRGGYLGVNLWSNNRGRTTPVHQIVCTAFHGPKPSAAHEVAHNDGDRMNNHWQNLRWATRAENEADKVRHGTSNRGERNGQAKIPDVEVPKVRALAASGTDLDVLATRYEVTRSAIYNIVTGRRRSP